MSRSLNSRAPGVLFWSDVGDSEALTDVPRYFDLVDDRHRQIGHSYSDTSFAMPQATTPTCTTLSSMPAM